MPESSDTSREQELNDAIKSLDLVNTSWDNICTVPGSVRFDGVEEPMPVLTMDTVRRGTEQTFTFTLLEVMRQFREQRAANRPEVEVLVVTHAGWKELQKRFPERTSDGIVPMISQIDNGMMYSMPVHIVENEIEAKARVLDLRMQDVRAFCWFAEGETNG